MTNLQNSPDPLRVAIIGGGFSGIAASIYLLSESADRGRKVECTLFEPTGLLGGGVAYATETPVHLLNVRAAGMSVYNDDPASFTRWLAANFPEYSANCFAPRQLYQRYLAYSLLEQQARSEKTARFQVHNESVRSISKCASAEYTLVSEQGRRTVVDAVVLALGNLPFTPSFGESAAAILQSPWKESSIQSAVSAKEVAIIGTGLTAIDVVLALESRNCRAHYTMISRHGQLPATHLAQPHDPVAAAKTHAVQIAEATDVRAAVQLFRNALDHGIPWRDLIDSLRPSTQAIWRNWNVEEKQRFLRHVRCLWDTHRHRVPGDTDKKLDGLRKLGRLTIVPGTVRNIEIVDENVRISLRKRGQASESALLADVAFNSVGLISDIRRHESPLLDSLIEQGIAQFDDTFLGLRASAKGNLVARDGNELSCVYVLGPLRRGELWETTAVREIRTQAQEIAKSLLERRTSSGQEISRHGKCGIATCRE